MTTERNLIVGTIFSFVIFIVILNYSVSQIEEPVITEQGSMIVYPVERDPFPKPLTEKQQEVFDEVNSGFIDFRKTLMKMEVDNIINLTKAYPDLLTDEEVNILLSVAIGKGHGMEDPEVDVKAIKIMYKIIEYLMDDQK